MTTMTDRKQDFSCNANYIGFSGDEYNLQHSSEEDDYYSNNDGPKVLTTMRNMFSDRKNDEYELVYDVPGQSQQRVFRVEPRSVPVNQSYLNFPPVQQQPQRVQINTQNVPRNYNFVPNLGPPRSAAPAPPPAPSVAPEPEEEEEEDHEEDDSFEDVNRIVHQCPECSKKYTSERRLKHHIEVHKNADAYKCPKCGYCYQSPDSLRRHWKKTPNCDETLAKTLNIELGGGSVPSTSSSSQPPPPPSI